VALATESTDVTVGADTNVGTAWVEGHQGDIGPGEVTCSTISDDQFAEVSTSSCGNNGFGSTWNIPAVQFNVTNPVAPDLFPGGPAQPINFTVDNLGSGPAHVGSIGIAIASNATGLVESTPGDANTAVTGCEAAWFGINSAPVNVNGNVPAGSTDFPSSATGASIFMSETGTNQDACEGAAVGLVFSSN
jgi:hypothetical protein